MPYREKDKLIHIFTVELGKVTAILKGVSSPNSKLKFAGQPFCFAKFDLAGSGEILTVKGVELIDSFFDLTSDYDKFVTASTMLELSSIVLKPGIIMESTFLSLIKSLQNIVYNGIDYRMATLKFVLTLLDNIGYGLNFNSCDNCGMKIVGDVKFSIDLGTFRCSACSGGVKMDKKDFMSLKIIYGTSIDRLHTIKISDDTITSLLKLMLDNISNKLGTRLRSVK